MADLSASYYNNGEGYNYWLVSSWTQETSAGLDVGTYTGHAESYNMNTVGTSPVGLTTDEWQGKVEANPQPIKYELVAITELFKKKNWLSNYTSQNLATLAANFETALTNYCEWTKNQGTNTAYCGELPADWIAGPGPQVT